MKRRVRYLTSDTFAPLSLVKVLLTYKLFGKLQLYSNKVSRSNFIMDRFIQLILNDSKKFTLFET